MKYTLIVYVVLTFFNQATAQTKIKHFVFFSRERERIYETNFLTNENIIGAQLKYMWRELEPIKDQYNLELIQRDLDFLTSKGKKLFIQIQDVTFDTAFAKPIPDYLITDTEYHGGVNIQYLTNEKDEIIAASGYVARRWDKAVAERFEKLLSALSNRFDGQIEGINLPETSVEFGNTGKLFPEGFTPDIYRNAIIDYMMMLKKSFPRSATIQYANFMPGEFPRRASKVHLDSVYEFASKNKIGMGVPDILVYNQPHMNHSYKFLRQYANSIISGGAVQDGNCEIINPNTGKQVTIKEIYDFSSEYLELDYIFWGTEEPYYTNEILPFIKSVK